MNLLKIRSYNILMASIYGDKPTDGQKIIATRSYPQVHTEIEFSERHNNISFSAEKGLGARFKDNKYSHEYRWNTVFVWMTDAQEDACMAAAKKLEGTPYDFIGLLGYITELDIIKPHPKKVWCTEAVVIVLMAGRKDFAEYLITLKQPVELKPDELDSMARYYFSKVEKFYDNGDSQKVVNELILAEKLE